MDKDMELALQTFLVESRELLQAMEDALLNLESEQSEPDDREAIGAIFRAAHTIKGSAGLFGLDAIVAFTHVTENLLDKVRNGEVAVNGDLIALLLLAGDHIGALVDQTVVRREETDEVTRLAGEVLMQRLRAFLGIAADVAQHSSVPVEHQTPLHSSGGGLVGRDSWHISLRFSRDVLKNGMDPLSFFRYLATLGKIVAITTLPDAMPPWESMDAECCYLGFEIEFKSDADKATIEGVFEFVREDCHLRILPPHSRVEEFIQLISELPEDKIRLGEILINSGVVTPQERDDMLLCQAMRAVAAESTSPDEAPLVPPLGEILVQEGMVQKELVDAALEKQKQAREHKAQESKYIRVHADKLDQLINLVGELVITGASAGLQAKRLRNAPLLETTSTLSRLVEEIRDGTLQLRMVQIGETFSRFNRVVRDVGKDLGKEIGLVVSGGETELDKSVVEKIGDPLMHLVRNSMDHGIESGELRLQHGKPAKGTVRLNAYHESGSIVIEVGDDGGGLKRERILAKALEKGLVTANQVLSDREVYALIFEAGFSTAEAVTNLSGRGVGMDVVRRNIEALRGTVEIDSLEMVGTTIRIRLPLTLAIIDGFMMGVGNETYIAPLDMVIECMQLTAAQREEAREHCFINLRGKVLPLIRLREYFQCQGKLGKRQNVVIVQYAGQKAGLVVDELMGEFQTVIKPLGKIFGNLKGISGSTILGSGDVALILDVPALIQGAAQAERQVLSCKS